MAARGPFDCTTPLQSAWPRSVHTNEKQICISEQHQWLLLLLLLLSARLFSVVFLVFTDFFALCLWVCVQFPSRSTVGRRILSLGAFEGPWLFLKIHRHSPSSLALYSPPSANRTEGFVSIIWLSLGSLSLSLDHRPIECRRFLVDSIDSRYDRHRRGR